MSRRSNRPLVAASAIAALALAGALCLLPAAHAQDAGGTPIVVGTYHAQAVAQATHFQQNLMQQMQGLQQRAQKAQQDGDQAAMQQIQSEARQMQQDATQKLLADIEAVMPQVAAKTGTQVIATEVTYTGPGITKKDVTQDVIDALQAASSGDDSMKNGAMKKDDGAMDGGSANR